MKTLGPYLLVQLLFWAVLPWQAGKAQHGFVRYYPEDSGQYIVIAILPKANGEYILSGQIGHFNPHSHNICVDAYGNPVWTIDTMALGIDYRGEDVNLGDSLFFTAGYTSNNQEEMSDAFLHCYDANGVTRWLRTYDSYPFDEFNRMAVSSRGKLFALGAYQFDSTLVDASFLVRLDLQGDVVWRREFQSLVDIVPSGIVALEDGNVVFGTVRDQVPRLHLMDSSGTLLWERNYPQWTLDDPFRFMQLMANGNLLCEGRDNTVRIFTSAGDLMKRFVETGNLIHAFQTADSNIVAHGSLVDGTDYYVRKYDTAGVELWYKTLHLSSDYYVSQIIEATNGDLLMVGWKGTNFFAPSAGLLIRTDCEGNVKFSSACSPEIVPSGEISLFPNPFHETISIENPVYEELDIRIFDSQGRLVWQQEVGLGNSLLDLQKLGRGIYLYRANSGIHVVTGRIVKV